MFAVQGILLKADRCSCTSFCMRPDVDSFVEEVDGLMHNSDRSGVVRAR